MAGRNNSRTVLSRVPFFFSLFPLPILQCLCLRAWWKSVSTQESLFFFLARMLSMLVYLFETKSSYQDAISKGFLGISLLPLRHTVPKVGVLRSNSDVERMRGHSSDHPIMPISWLLKIPCCELVDDRSTWLLTKPYHWFGHKRPSSGPWRWTLMFGQIHTSSSLSLSLWAPWKMLIFTNNNSAK